MAENPGAIGGRLEEFQDNVTSFCKKYISEILSAKFFNAIPQLVDSYREYQVFFVETEF